VRKGHWEDFKPLSYKHRRGGHSLATRTAVIHVGAGHPNDDGLIDPPGVTSWWLIEGARPIWLLSLDTGQAKRSKLLPRHPSSTLTDGLIAVLASLSPREGKESRPREITDMLSGSTVDLANLPPRAYDGLLTRTKAQASEFGGKLIVSGFLGSVILGQTHQLLDFEMDVEVLTPTGTRLWSRWRREVVTTGSMAGEAA